MNIAKSLKSGLDRIFGVQPLACSQTDIARWFELPLGQRILEREQELFDKVMPSMYGYHLMQLSVLNGVDLSRLSPVTHHFSLAVNDQQPGQGMSRFEQLPIAADSIDVAILHHALEYSTHPHQLLREAARTIIPNGYLIIVGFNPWSLLSTKKTAGRLLTRRSHWRYHNLRRSRIIDWLQVLDFEPAIIQYGSHGLPFDSAHNAQVESAIRWLLPACGDFYFIVARKSVAAITLIEKPWKKTAPLPQWVKGGVVSGKTVSNKEVSR